MAFLRWMRAFSFVDSMISKLFSSTQRVRAWITVRTTARVEDGLLAEAAALESWGDAAAHRAALAIAEEAKKRVPVDQGDLRDAIHVERVGPGEFAVVAGDEDEVFYGHMVEFGTTKTPAQPFLIPAVEAVKEEVVGELSASLRATLASKKAAEAGFAAALAESVNQSTWRG